MYRTEAERKGLWERDQIHYAEIAHQYPCCDVPTVLGCLHCKIDPDLCKNKAGIISEDASNEDLRAQLRHSCAQVDNLAKLLTSIHMLLYPQPINTEDGRTMVFRPRDVDPHDVLQKLSDRIRALPDELTAIRTDIKTQ